MSSEGVKVWIARDDDGQGCSMFFDQPTGKIGDGGFWVVDPDGLLGIDGARYQPTSRLTKRRTIDLKPGECRCYTLTECEDDDA